MKTSQTGVASGSAQKSYYPWVVVGLLWVVALLNYMDRQMLSTMQQNIAADIPALPESRDVWCADGYFPLGIWYSKPLLGRCGRPCEPQVAPSWARWVCGAA